MRVVKEGLVRVQGDLGLKIEGFERIYFPSTFFLTE